ncbi:hypothetical protein CHS0354_037157 [Potamilus streckersoni]|uniref:Uncharacterized protein n=1 Tax=Potamilus streckersoni TaxID=2493646 RepID=A0AAE0W331_9BIVA|nr:hypothetical protein CHS0354_037157 [Potamilus streckersoni]
MKIWRQLRGRKPQHPPEVRRLQQHPERRRTCTMKNRNKSKPTMLRCLKSEKNEKKKEEEKEKQHV